MAVIIVEERFDPAIDRSRLTTEAGVRGPNIPR